MYRKIVILLMSSMLLIIAPSLTFASVSDVNTAGVPSKVEFITSENGKVIPVYYFDSPEDAEIFKQNRYKNLNGNKNNANNNITPNAFGVIYEYEEYLGVRPYDYSYVYVRNSTSSPQTYERTISRTFESTTSVSVGVDFKNYFEASTNREWKETQDWSDKFTVTVPPGKQAEIWTWNEAQYYTFSQRSCFIVCGGKQYFNVINVTKNVGHDIIIVDFRNPGG